MPLVGIEMAEHLFIGCVHGHRKFDDCAFSLSSQAKSNAAAIFRRDNPPNEITLFHRRNQSAHAWPGDSVQVGKEALRDARVEGYGLEDDELVKTQA